MFDLGTHTVHKPSISGAAKSKFLFAIFPVNIVTLFYILLREPHVLFMHDILQGIYLQGGGLAFRFTSACRCVFVCSLLLKGGSCVCTQRRLNKRLRELMRCLLYESQRKR